MAQQANTTYKAGDLAEPILGVRKDTATALADADGKYSPLQTDEFGNLRTVQPESVAGESVYESMDGRRVTPTRDHYSSRLLEEILLTLIQIRDSLQNGR